MPTPEKLLTYALGRGVEHYDMPVVRSIAAAAAADDYRFQSLITAVVLSEPFRSSRKPSETLTGPARKAADVTAAVTE